MKFENIQAILFDSADVLNTTATGNWFLSPRFFSYVDREQYDALSQDKRRAAFRPAADYLNAQKRIVTLDEELAHFKRYYEIFFEALPELGVTQEQAHAIATDLVYNTDKYAFYEDALRLVPAYRKTRKLAVISDAWPSLRDGYKACGLYDCFDAFVISSELGTLKPDPLMYQTALDVLRIPPEQAVFIDDNPANCEGATALGIPSLLLCRSKRRYWAYKLISATKPYRVIDNLDQLQKLL